MVIEGQEQDMEQDEEGLERHFTYLKFLASAILLFCGISLFFVFDLGTFTVFDLPMEANFTALGVILILMVSFLIALLVIFYKTTKEIDEMEENEGHEKQ
jgi:uncharacterized membrane protein